MALSLKPLFKKHITIINVSICNFKIFLEIYAIFFIFSGNIFLLLLFHIQQLICPITFFTCCNLFVPLLFSHAATFLSYYFFTCCNIFVLLLIFQMLQSFLGYAVYLYAADNCLHICRIRDSLRICRGCI